MKTVEHEVQSGLNHKSVPYLPCSHVHNRQHLSVGVTEPLDNYKDNGFGGMTFDQPDDMYSNGNNLGCDDNGNGGYGGLAYPQQPLDVWSARISVVGSTCTLERSSIAFCLFRLEQWPVLHCSP